MTRSIRRRIVREFEPLTSILLLGSKGEAAKAALPEILAVYSTLGTDEQSRVRGALNVISSEAGKRLLVSQTR